MSGKMFPSWYITAISDYQREKITKVFRENIDLIQKIRFHAGGYPTSQQYWGVSDYGKVCEYLQGKIITNLEFCTPANY